MSTAVTTAEKTVTIRQIAAIPRMLDALRAAWEALDNYSDVVDGDDGRPRPNRAMSAMADVSEALKAATGEEW